MKKKKAEKNKMAWGREGGRGDLGLWEIKKHAQKMEGR